MNPIRRRPIQTIIQNPELVEERHEQIFRAASRVFVSRGYDRATVREIAEEAGLSLGSLYTYIKTKEDILYLVFEKLTAARRENIRQAITGKEGAVEQIDAAVRAHLRTVQRYQDEVLLMYQETKSLGPDSLRAVLSREADYVKFFEGIVQAGCEAGVFRGDPALTANIIVYLCALLALRRWNLRRALSEEEVVEGLVRFILGGLGVGDGA